MNVSLMFIFSGKYRFVDYFVMDPSPLSEDN